jgi:hypothetical protein
MMLLQFGNMNKELAKYNTRMFAEKVLPKLRHVHSEWEDRWWPEPMEQKERAAPSEFVPAQVAAAE